MSLKKTQRNFPIHYQEKINRGRSNKINIIELKNISRTLKNLTDPINAKIDQIEETISDLEDRPLGMIQLKKKENRKKRIEGGLYELWNNFPNLEKDTDIQK